jgi:short-subunit dehydrogenase
LQNQQINTTPQVAFVTGATSGIGRATALLFASMGYGVVATGRREERLNGLVEEASSLSGEIHPIMADVTSAEDMQRAVADTLAHFNRLDVLVANAGLGHRGQLTSANWQDLEDVLRVNIDGVLHSVRAAVPALRASGGGHIVMVNSVLAALPAPGSAIYAASKATLSSIAQALRMELRADNIWVTDVLVGQTHTEFAEKRRGHAGSVAKKLPTMTPERVAAQIVRATEQRRRTLILRPLDRLMVVGGRLFPWIMDRILLRVYGKAT